MDLTLRFNIAEAIRPLLTAVFASKLLLIPQKPLKSDNFRLKAEMIGWISKLMT